MYIVNKDKLFQLAFTNHLDEKRFGTTRRARLSNIQIFHVLQEAIKDVELHDSFVVTFPRRAGDVIQYTGILVKRHADILVAASIFEETKNKDKRTIFIKEKHRINTTEIQVPEVQLLLLILKELYIIKIKRELKFMYNQLKFKILQLKFKLKSKINNKKG